MNIIEQIHQEIDNSVLILKNNIKENNEKINNPEKYSNEDILNSVLNAGFINTPAIKEFNSYKDNVRNIHDKKNNLSNLYKVLEKYSNIGLGNSFKYNFILYSQVIKICEKYNLYISNAKNYTENIPEKNMNDIKDFFINSKIKPLETYLDAPLCYHFKNNGYSNKESVLYIIAPENHFIKNNFKIGKELIKDENIKFKFIKPVRIPDPIILCPIAIPEIHEIGFYIVTKWGNEANITELSIPKNN